MKAPLRYGRPAVGSLEALVALGVLTTVLSVAPPVLLKNQRLMRDQRFYRLAVDALTNRLDEVARLDQERLQAAIQPTLVGDLPGAVIRGRLDKSEPGVRITLTLTAPERGGKSPAVQLVGWSFTASSAGGAGGEGEP